MQQNRRQFLEQSLLSAAAAGLWAGGQERASLAEDQPAATGSVAANDVLGVAVVGVNGRGGAHVDGFGKRPDCRIVAIVDVDESVANRRAEAIEKQFGYRPTVYRDLRDCLKDSAVDIVSVATPNHWHALAAIWAIQAGKDVYVEKPVSHNVTEGRRVVEAARKYERIVQTGTQSRSNPGMKAAIDYVHSGAIGKISLARGLCYKRRGSIGAPGNYDVPASVDYNLWCGPAPVDVLNRPQMHYDWHWQWAFGNGDLGNQGIHQMDIARWGLQGTDLGESVQSFGGRVGYEDAGETANTQVCVHQFSGDRKLIFEVRGLETEAYLQCKVGVIFYGTEGYVALPSYNGGAAFDLAGKKIKDFEGGSDDHHFANFIQAVRSRKVTDLNADILEGHLSSALCHVGNISYRLGQPAVASEGVSLLGSDPLVMETYERTLRHLQDNKLDPQTTKLQFGPSLTLGGTEEFSGPRAEEANKLLTREYRAPFIVPKTEDL